MGISLHFLGAAGGVTGSRYLLDVDGTRILVDCGLFQGRRDESRKLNASMPCDGDTIDDVILTHAHIDHSGALPTLVKCGFKGRFLCTPATADLARILLRDSGFIQEKDAEYLNKKKKEAARADGQWLPSSQFVEPLYTSEDAEACDPFFHGVQYHKTFEIRRGIRLSFTDQGHIIGAAAALVEIDTDDGPLRIVFGGDRGRRGMPILRDPERYPACDYLLTESTYGDRLHEPTSDNKKLLKELIEKVRKRAGKIVIPAFSVGRTQNILYDIAELLRSGEMDRIEVFVDSPLSTRATQVYADHPECYDKETREFFTQEISPFNFPGLTYIEDVEHSRALNDRPGPAVILSASGMCESGRVLHHLKHNVTDPRNVVLLVGFMAEHTLGRKLRDGASEVRIYDGIYPVRAEVVSAQGFSAHADRDDLLDSVAHLKGVVKRIFLVHGESEQSTAFKQHLHDAGFKDVHIARKMERVRLA